MKERECTFERLPCLAVLKLQNSVVKYLNAQGLSDLPQIHAGELLVGKDELLTLEQLILLHLDTLLVDWIDIVRLIKNLLSSPMPIAQTSRFSAQARIARTLFSTGPKL